MTIAAPYLRPLPQPTPFSQPFFDNLKRHVFSVPRCQDCGAYNWVPYPACRTCQSDRVEWTPVSGEGEVFSFTVVHRGPAAFSGDGPYVICLGRLREQPRSCLVGGVLVECAPDAVRIGLGVKIGYQDIPDEDITMWRWELA